MADMKRSHSFMKDEKDVLDASSAENNKKRDLGPQIEKKEDSPIEKAASDASSLRSKSPNGEEGTSGNRSNASDTTDDTEHDEIEKEGSKTSAANKKQKAEEDGKPPASLVSIPGEIRNQIYSYLDFYGGVVCLHCPATRGATKDERYVKPALTRVCSLLRQETLLWYYSENRFEMTCSWTEGTDCAASHGSYGELNQDWLVSIEPHYDHLRDVKFRLPGWGTWTRFKLTEFRPDDYFLAVTTGRPLKPQRAVLLKLLIESYFYDPGRLDAFWTGTDLAYFLRDLPGVVECVEKIAWAKGPANYRSNFTFNPAEEGFLQLICPKRFQQQVETVDWNALQSDPATCVFEEDEPGALLVSKEVPCLMAMLMGSVTGA